MLSATSAWREGARRTWHAPAMCAGLYLTLFLVAVPLAVVIRGMIADHLGDSAVAVRVARGSDWTWWQEFSQQAAGLGVTFTPSILGFAAPLGNLSNLLDNEPMAKALAGVVGAWLVIWSFLSGGILDRLARGRRLGTATFFAAAGTYFFRFVRLGVVALAVYYVLFTAVHGVLFEDIYDWATRNIAVERTAFLIRLTLYLVFALMLAACSLIFDYARVRMVVEDRRSALGAIGAAIRFLRRHGRPAIALYLLVGGVFLALLAVWAFVAPGAGHNGVAMWLAFLLGQLYIAARLFLKLVAYGSQTVLFQTSLAQADYNSAPLPEWPESPAAEAVSGGR